MENCELFWRCHLWPPTNIRFGLPSKTLPNRTWSDLQGLRNKSRQILKYFSIEIYFYVSTSFATVILEIKDWSGMFTCIKYLTQLDKVYSRPKLRNNWTAFKKDIMWRLQKKQGKFSIYWTCFMILDFYWTSSKCTNANGADLWQVEFNERIAQNSDHLSLCHSPAFRSEVNQH